MSTYSSQFSIRRLWRIFAATMILMFGVLLYFGQQIYQVKPPIPGKVVTVSGQTLYTRAQIEHGQNVWQSMGGMQQGSIWGHGSYVAPDWSAEWLNREARAMLEILGQTDTGTYGDLAAPEQARVQALVREDMRANTFDAMADTVTVSEPRAQAIARVEMHFMDLLGARTAEARVLREQYAMPLDAVLTPEESQAVAAFYFWAAWAATTVRPGETFTYTSNWPYEPLVGNAPTGSLFLWTFLSVFLLLAGVGALVWYYAKEFDLWRRDGVPEGGYAKADFMDSAVVTASMLATRKYFLVVVALFLAQIGLGIVTAHYAVDGQGFYGLAIAKYFPYALTRTWHTQLSVLWIAAAWLATGLYVAPLLGGRDPKWQVAGVNFLWLSLLVIVVGSFAGEWLAINRMMPDMVMNFWFGTQGYEYVDLGRFWQIYLFIGLILWVVLILRAMWPALKAGETKSLLYLIVLSTVAIGLLFGAGMMYGQHTHISIMEYWRWWVVHLWVEGVFEVFATAIVSALFVRMGLVRVSVATTSVLVATLIFLGAGVLGTFHHLYFSGTPTAVIALGGVFSALEVVPLVVIGFEAYNRSHHAGVSAWESNYRWPFMFFAAVLVWNLVGAGLLGFLINPPLALYYMQGLNTTATHGHAALFGVYGMLGLGLMLFCLRGLTDPARWNVKLLAASFWCLNIGLGMMLVMSLLPQGLLQAYASFTRGYAYARSPELIHSPAMENLVWARVPGDIVFSVGVACFALFVVQALLAARRRSAAGGAALSPAE